MSRTTAIEDAEAMLEENPTARYGISTDSEIRPGWVAVGIAIRGKGSMLMSVQAAEYDGRKVMEALDRVAA